MKMSDVPDDEIIMLRDAYRGECRRETQASESVRRQWRVVALALDEVLTQRNGGRRTVLDATKMVRPGDEPLA